MKLRKINTVIKRQSDSPRAKRQQQNRRKESLFKKAYEYSIGCDAEVYLSIRIKRNGQILVFDSDNTREWPLSDMQIVGQSLPRSWKADTNQDKYYPVPVQITPEDFQRPIEDEKDLEKPDSSEQGRSNPTWQLGISCSQFWIKHHLQGVDSLVSLPITFLLECSFYPSTLS